MNTKELTKNNVQSGSFDPTDKLLYLDDTGGIKGATEEEMVNYLHPAPTFIDTSRTSLLESIKNWGNTHSVGSFCKTGSNLWLNSNNESIQNWDADHTFLQLVNKQSNEIMMFTAFSTNYPTSMWILTYKNGNWTITKK